MTLEKNIEKAAVAELERRGFFCIKLGLCGLPDRMVLMPGGRVVFLEFKTATGRLRAAQAIWKTRLEKMGFYVAIPRTRDDALAAVLQRAR